MKSEVERLHKNISSEKPDGAIIVFSANSDDPETSLIRVKEVLQYIFDADTERESWPTYEEWKKRLPSWFTIPCEDLTVSEVLSDPNIWPLDGWLEAMRLRGWEWWSSSCDPDQGTWTAMLLQQELVYSIEPLIYLARESGASTVEVREE